MATRPIEEHLAEFLRSMRDPRMKDYRRRCLLHWRQAYGEATAARVEGIVGERWEAKAGQRKSAGSGS